MLIAATTRDDGRKLLVIGLHPRTSGSSLNDRPIYKRFDGQPDEETEAGPRVEGLEEWDITILGPEDLVRFVATFAPEQAD
jgi:hypothetical protein